MAERWGLRLNRPIGEKERVWKECLQSVFGIRCVECKENMNGIGQLVPLFSMTTGCLSASLLAFMFLPSTCFTGHTHWRKQTHTTAVFPRSPTQQQGNTSERGRSGTHSSVSLPTRPFFTFCHLWPPPTAPTLSLSLSCPHLTPVMKSQNKQLQCGRSGC